MGARYLKTEEAEIREHYPTATRAEMLERIPTRTWQEIGAHARHMGIKRTKEAKGVSIREGRALFKNTYSPSEEIRFSRMYPIATYAELLSEFPERSLAGLKSHAQRLGLHRTREAREKQIAIGRRNVRKSQN